MEEQTYLVKEIYMNSGFQEQSYLGEFDSLEKALEFGIRFCIQERTKEVTISNDDDCIKHIGWHEDENKVVDL